MPFPMVQELLDQLFKKPNTNLKVCPAHAIDFLPADKKVRIFVSQCIQCGQCTEICPKQCLALSEQFLNASHDRYDTSLVVDK